MILFTLRAFLSSLVLLLFLPLSAQKMEGMASFYADKFDGQPTSTGETFRQNGFMAASKDLPWGTIVEVTNLSNGKKTQVRINDCGPHAKGRIIDLSRRAAQELDFIKQGDTKVKLRIIRASNSGPTCGRGAWSKKLKAAGQPIPAKPGPWKPEDTAQLTVDAPAPLIVPNAPVATPAPATTLRGLASYYADNFAGQNTSTGEIYDPSQYTAASKMHPYNTTLEVTNIATGQQVMVRVNDCGPHRDDRVLDLSKAAAAKVGLLRAGVASMDIRVVKLGTDGPTCNRSGWVDNNKQNQAAAGTPLPPATSQVARPMLNDAAAVNAYFVQLGAFRQRASADQLRNRLAAKGYRDARVEILNEAGLWATTLSTFYTKAAGEQVKAQVIKDGWPKAVLKQRPVDASVVQDQPMSKIVANPNAVALAPPAEPRSYSNNPAPATAPPSGQGTETAYNVQLGAFRQERSAYELYDAVAAKGYTDVYVYQNPETQLFTTSLQTVYDKKAANEVKAELKKDGFPKAAVKEVQAFPSGIQSKSISKQTAVAPTEQQAPGTYGSQVAQPKSAKKTFEPDVILFGVQIGAYGSEEGAARAKAELEAAGNEEIYDAKVGKLFRVFAGKFYFQSQAEVLKDKLRKQGFETATVRRVQ